MGINQRCERVFTLLQFCQELIKKVSRRPTEDGDRHTADSDFSAELVRYGALVRAAVLRGGMWDTQGVDDPVWESLFQLNCTHSL